MMKTWICLLLLTFALTFAAAASAEEAYKVIAHPSVPVTSISREELSMLFLKKTSTFAKWGNSQKVVPFDLPADSSSRESFSKSVHKKPTGAVKSYWQQQIFSGRGTPPAEVAGEAEMIASVARTTGAIGYVSGGATLPAGVKQLKTMD